MLLLPMGMDPSKIMLYLEFQLGIVLPKPLSTSVIEQASSRKTDEACGAEKELYETIVSVFKDRIAQIIEFDYE